MKAKMPIICAVLVVFAVLFSVLSTLNVGISNASLEGLVPADIAWVSMAAGLVGPLMAPIAAEITTVA